MRALVIIFSILYGSLLLANVLSEPEFGYVPVGEAASYIWSSESGSKLVVRLKDNLMVNFGQKEIAAHFRLFTISTLETSISISPQTVKFYIQDRKPFLAFNHLSLSFSFGKDENVRVASLFETYGILPDEYINTGFIISIGKSYEITTKLIAQVRLWRVGMIASMNLGGGKACGLSFFFSF